MNKFRAVVALLLASTTDAFTSPFTTSNLGEIQLPRKNYDCQECMDRNNRQAKSASRSETKVFMRNFDTGNTNTIARQQTLKNTTSVPSSSQLGNADVAYSVSASKTTTLAIAEDEDDDNAYVRFAKEYPFVNNFIIASLKTTVADLLAQIVIAQTPLDQVDLQRSLLFCAFGGIYSGAFQYLYQVQIFKKLFDVDKFTSQSWSQKLRDIPGMQALAAQTTLDLTVLTLVYLPAFYIFKASVFTGTSDPSVWFSSGVSTYTTNFGKDEADLLKVWLPADLVCFSVPLYLRMPVRQSVSFLWTAYLSFARGGH